MNALNSVRIMEYGVLFMCVNTTVCISVIYCAMFSERAQQYIACSYT